MSCDGFLTKLDSTEQPTPMTCYECSRPVTGAPEVQHADCIRESDLRGHGLVRYLRVDTPEMPDGYVENW